MSLFAITLAVLVAAVLLLGTGQSDTANKLKVPWATIGARTWSHGELIQHLKSQGLQFDAAETHFGGFYGPAMEFTFPRRGTVYVQIRKAAQEAKDAASPKGQDAFAWDRFYFQGDPELLAKIRAAL